MNYSPILIVAGEPNSIFSEIFFKTIKKIKIKKPVILIASKKLIELQMRKLKFNIKIRTLNKNELLISKLDNKSINLIDVNFKTSKAFSKISIKSNKYIENCFDIAFYIIKKNNIKNLITGPISKKTFLNKKYLGLTEYISKKFKVKHSAMLIYNERLSVSPVTTHLPLKFVPKKINKNLIVERVKLLNDFYKKKLKKVPKIAILGLNPHCESVDKFNEDERILKPTIKYLKKRNFKVFGPFPADTIFLKKNMKKYNVILGMYHDQVLTPIKALFEYDAINITVGLPFIRIAPDHGPNETMLGKNISNPLSLIKAISFLDKC
ncbi:4-hydroxythreonine-4-phosphate dehydrogenase PdxA [Candidatus Pelagibacter sp.]|nr:4-hydroxythreonine-4-phosphate dehydrogenase PdxA [Candidatus Pelagibacter sp.]